MPWETATKEGDSPVFEMSLVLYGNYSRVL